MNEGQMEDRDEISFGARFFEESLAAISFRFGKN